ncbi:hypothetical protein AVEN_224365-1 [Araneus ventricosus]|uniref:Uncharacterized protein n=1 Tax=Araneus ventricosus TaxID=182803 RepID=A0A4Y2MBR9_ARAVE|nr:hypothetical protein AVEN_224365-1 [Araneus ventricosus]
MSAEAVSLRLVRVDVSSRRQPYGYLKERRSAEGGVLFVWSGVEVASPRRMQHGFLKKRDVSAVVSSSSGQGSKCLLVVQHGCLKRRVG